MNKEEILAKSRKENKNRDIAGMDINKNASRISLIGIAFCLLYISNNLFVESTFCFLSFSNSSSVRLVSFFLLVL